MAEIEAKDAVEEVKNDDLTENKYKDAENQSSNLNKMIILPSESHSSPRLENQRNEF